MRKRSLGATGLEVSEIAFGGVEIGVPYGIGIASEADMLSEKEAIQLLHAALDAGINFFDTARQYGMSEYLMGKAFQGRRQETIISTKCRHFRDKEGKLPPDTQLRTFIKASLHESLEALQTDYVDVFMLHQADLEILENATIRSVFQELKASGKIRATGASTYTVGQTEKALTSGAWDVLQIPFNLMDQRQGNLFNKAGQLGTGLVVRSVLMKGLLSNRGKNLHPALSEVEQHIAGYNSVLGDKYSSLPALATKFALSFNDISSVLVGMDRMEYLQQSLDTANGMYMSPAELEWAKQRAYPRPEFLDLPHWDRMGWLT